MNIKVVLYGHLQWYAPGQQKNHQLHVHGDTDVAGVIERLDLPRPEVATLVLNGEPVDDHHKLQEGDELVVIPVISGG